MCGFPIAVVSTKKAACIPQPDDKKQDIVLVIDHSPQDRVSS
jgi:hypothetical protein